MTPETIFLLKDILTLYGPLTLGWIAASFLFFELRKSEISRTKLTKEVTDRYVATMEENTRVLSALNELIRGRMG